MTRFMDKALDAVMGMGTEKEEKADKFTAGQMVYNVLRRELFMICDKPFDMRGLKFYPCQNARTESECKKPLSLFEDELVPMQLERSFVKRNLKVIK